QTKEVHPRVQGRGGAPGRVPRHADRARGRAESGGLAHAAARLTEARSGLALGTSRPPAGTSALHAPNTKGGSIAGTALNQHVVAEAGLEPALPRKADFESQRGVANRRK